MNEIPKEVESLAAEALRLLDRIETQTIGFAPLQFVRHVLQNLSSASQEDLEQLGLVAMREIEPLPFIEAMPLALKLYELTSALDDSETNI